MVLPAQSLSQRMQILGFEKGSIRQTDKVEKPRVFPPEIRAVGIQGRGLSIALQTRPSLVWESVCGKDLDSSPVLVCLTAQVPPFSISGWYTDDGKALSGSGHSWSLLSSAFIFKSYRKAGYYIPV